MEGFFLKSCKADPSYISFAIQRYGRNLDDMPYDYGMEIIDAGIDELKNEKMWQLYLSIYPKMTEETFMSFSDFLEYQNKPPQPVHTKEQILDNVQNILRRPFRKEVIA